jgi:peroxiredoxin Q/BCP
LISLRDSEKELADWKIAYFMVSLDTVEKNREFADSVSANFVLLSDPDEKNAEAYGVLGFGGFWAKRWTFYIDAEGVIRKIDKEVETSTHGKDVIRTLGELGFPRS